MGKWTEAEETTLRDLAGDGLTAALIADALPERTESAVAARASKLKVPLRGAGNLSAVEYLKNGGWLVRDEVGGVIGVRWGAATRTGESFAARFCNRLADLGFIEPAPDRANVFHWRGVA